MNSVAPTDAFGLLEDLVDELELEAILQQPPEQVHARLVANGADLERVRVMVEHALGEGPPPAARKPRAQVIPLTPRPSATPSRVIPILRGISVAVAASFFGIFVWRQGSMGVEHEGRGRTELSDSRPTPPPSYMVDADLQKAKLLRAEAYKLCDQNYWGECWDKLDDARRLDKVGDDTLEVHEARNRIGRALDAETHGAVPTMVKPSIGPNERPLQRRTALRQVRATNAPAAASNPGAHPSTAIAPPAGSVWAPSQQA